ncbi:glucosyltransferase domain-containing protein [Enterobacter hormaechei]|uniref:glucosyltransferase domain-containing protein n=1 Tax=Enterobacter hormaechei TaxID=158836 RepID=UPI001B0512F5|nr:glucosyltransferase domain-containing protein [Enterobacter hormaechei]MBU5618591.1 glucosyltransferase domain-containing protein [Enterobacteriaceae bacterium S5_ASV_15]HBA4062319.1 hypothetical protein [Escherichia coli]MBY5208114.1 hypothetical protein [Enterobacter hormaechei]HBC9733194.1 glucosyltransferase domain-containing protein [Escherichia coli]HBD0032792.1 glucosyltransferase domain-containing protein [Escherichia coli]
MIDLKKDLTLKQFLLTLSLMAFLFAMPIILSGSYYVDDIIRANTGMLGWWSLGRPISDVAVSLVSFSINTSSDVYPVTILLACLTNILTSYILCKIFKLKYNLSSALICSLPVINPLYIQNMMYRYDCLPMSLAIMLSVYSYYINTNKNITSSITSIIMLIVSFMLYQPATPAFVVLAIFSYAYREQSKENNNIIAKSALHFATAIILYSLYTRFSVTTSRSKLVFERKDWFDFMIGNSMKLFDIYVKAYTTVFILVISALCIYCVAKYTFAIFKNKHINAPHKWIGMIMAPYPAYALIAASILIIIIAEWPAGPRVAIPFGFFVFGVVLLTYKYTTYKSMLIIIPAYLIFYSIVSSSAVSNAYSSQIKMDYNTALMLANDLENSNSNTGKIFVSGRTKSTDLAINNERSFPIIKSINFPANHWIMSLILKEYGFRNVEINGKIKEKESMAQSACAKNILVNKYRYEICRANGNTYIILK